VRQLLFDGAESRALDLFDFLRVLVGDGMGIAPGRYFRAAFRANVDCAGSITRGDFVHDAAVSDANHHIDHVSLLQRQTASLSSVTATVFP
jgi:hypothetical protein